MSENCKFFRDRRTLLNVDTEEGCGFLELLTEDVDSLPEFGACVTPEKEHIPSNEGNLAKLMS